MRSNGLFSVIGSLLLGASAGAAFAGNDPASLLRLPDWLSVHAQFTGVAQSYPSFTSPFEGDNSLPGHAQAEETVDGTLYLGARLFEGLEIYVDPEIDQGFGLGNTLGAGGYPSGEAYKVGKTRPYFRLHRAFLRYTLDLGGGVVEVEDAPNQLGGEHGAQTLTVTLGKFSVVDLFDTNVYAHDPRSDFLNWAVIESGAYDYAADAWGYTYGAALEWTRAWWTLRAGAFDLSKVPNSKELETRFQQFELVSEAEIRHHLLREPGKLKVLAFANRGRMGSYEDSVELALQNGGVPDTASVRRYRTRPGVALNLEQGLTPEIGSFARMSVNVGNKEAFEFTEINRSVALGLSMKGTDWKRPADTVGLAGVVNDISHDARRYFAAGGLGILIGDGQLPDAASERILELYYKAALVRGLDVTLDYQYLKNPAYDAARGPIDIFGLRLHAEF